jgi:acetyl esterase/lipase
MTLRMSTILLQRRLLRLVLWVSMTTLMFSVPLLLAADQPLVLPLWPGTPPGEIGNIGPEKFWTQRPDGKPIPPVAGKPVKWLTNVSIPTLTISRPPKDKDTGAAMVICPGGGLTYLAWDVEGEEVVAWLNSIGITGIILKYRVPRRPDQMDFKKFGISTWLIRPLQDGQRAISLVRSKAAEWGLDPQRIGMIGFSAGAGVTVWTAANFEKRFYAAVDAVDQVSCRPDFGVMLYCGGGASPSPSSSNYELTPDLPIHRGCPPLFLVATSDDGDKAEIAICIYQALKKAGSPAELHIYSKGGHDFGLRPSANPCSTWPLRCVDWLSSSGWLRPAQP